MVIGVTGGVGAGKSAVLGIFKERYGASLIMADDVARELMEPGRASYDGVVAEFGWEILENPRERFSPINRKALADIVFSDKERLAALNSITHPAVKEEIKRRIRREYVLEPEVVIVVEAALLIEAGYEDLTDCLCVIITDKESRIKRLMASRGYTREKCESVIANQMSDEEFEAHADFVIDNSADLENTANQVAKIMKKLIR